MITYRSGDTQKLAVATGMVDAIWPTKIVTGKTVVLSVSGR